MLTWASNSSRFVDGMELLSYFVVDGFGFAAVMTHSNVRCIEVMDGCLAFIVRCLFFLFSLGPRCAGRCAFHVGARLETNNTL